MTPEYPQFFTPDFVVNESTVSTLHTTLERFLLLQKYDKLAKNHVAARLKQIRDFYHNLFPNAPYFSVQTEPFYLNLKNPVIPQSVILGNPGHQLDATFHCGSSDTQKFSSRIEIVNFSTRQHLHLDTAPPYLNFENSSIFEDKNSGIYYQITQNARHILFAQVLDQIAPFLVDLPHITHKSKH